MNEKNRERVNMFCRPCWMSLVVTACALAVGASQSPAQEGVDVEEIGILPQDKKAIEVSPDESNPFAIVQAVKPDEDSFVDSTLEEQKIRTFFSDITIQGITRSQYGYKVLMGGMILEVGDMVPPVVPNQTERLQVTKIDEESIEVSWVEDEDKNARSPQTRILRKDLNVVRPGVKTMTPGSSAGSEDGFVRKMGDPQEELRQAPNLIAEP